MKLTKSSLRRIHLGDVAQWSGLLGGLGLIAYGLKRRSWGGLGLALAGTSLTFHSATRAKYLLAAAHYFRQRRARTPSATMRRTIEKGITVERTVTINRSPEDLYRYWRNFENLPHFMRHLKSVRVMDDKRSHWVVQGPAGLSVEWDAEIVKEIENELIGWRSLENADVDNTGLVYFERLPSGRGARVKMVLRYAPPGGRVGAVFAKLFGRDAEHEVREDLRHFKQLMEAGETPTTEGQPSGREHPRAHSKRALRERQPELVVS
ncbi:MAG: SRPBCC family protein [Anaerolineales bacterium]